MGETGAMTAEEEYVVHEGVERRGIASSIR